MNRTPYNFCDYRCEHCLETANCDVFKRVQRDRLLEGGDHAARLDALRSSFRETEDRIKQNAREFGIDIDEIAGGASFEEISQHRQGTLRDALYREALDLSARSGQFLAAGEAVVPGSEQEYLDDIAWHHTLVPAKVYRALGWRADGAIADDAKGSAAVAMKSLTICIMAFDQLASRVPQLEGEGRRLSAAGSQLKESIKKRFRPS